MDLVGMMKVCGRGNDDSGDDTDDSQDDGLD